MKNKPHAAEMPRKVAPPVAPASSPTALAAPQSLLPWVFAGFIITYLLFLLIPVFFNKNHVMNEICPVFRVENTGVGLDLYQILGFSRGWFVEHRPLYSIGDNSYPPLEAMAAGVPVVSTSAGSLAEVLGDAALVVPVSDPDALSAALLQVLTDSAVAGRLAATGPPHAASFSWERCAAGLMAVYRRAMTNR
jgi:glycosyltransferase involved in cell wall biosynthesis